MAFQRAPRGYAATVHIGGARGGTRKLSNEGPGCRALANAVGMLLVLVLDSNDDAAVAPPPGPASASAAAPAARSGDVNRRADVSLGGGVAEGLVGGWSPAVDVGGTLTYDAVSVRLGGFWLPAKSHELGAGRVEVGLAAARLALCVAPTRDRFQVGLGLCLQQQAGWTRGRGVGYDVNRTADHLWLATGAAIVGARPRGARSAGRSRPASSARGRTCSSWSATSAPRFSRRRRRS